MRLLRVPYLHLATMNNVPVRVSVTNVEEMIWEYLRTHKTPVLAHTLAKKFVVSQSHIARTLKDFEVKRMIVVTQVGKQKFYKANAEFSG
jgi:redox-regulated HSP33 family molecular chaperone